MRFQKQQKPPGMNGAVLRDCDGTEVPDQILRGLEAFALDAFTLKLTGTTNGLSFFTGAAFRRLFV